MDAKAPLLLRLGNGLDRGLSLIAPRFAAKRIAARNYLHHFSYDAAKDTRFRNRAWTDFSPESSTISWERVQLIKEARDLDQNFPPVSRMLQFERDYVFGKLRYKPRTGDTATNAEYADYLRDWFRVCDVTGRDTFRLLCQQWHTAHRRDGDCGVIFVESDGELRLQSIEGDCIGGNLMSSAAGKNLPKTYINGINVDGLGRPVSYKIFTRTAAGGYENPKDIPALSFIHIARRKRTTEYRPVSAFAPVITTCRDVKEIVDAMRISTKWEAFQSAFVTRQGGVAPPSTYILGNGADPNNADAKQRLQRMEPGTVHYGEPGEGVVVFKSDRPAMPWQQFIAHLINLTALGLNYPPAVVFWLSGLGSAEVRGQLEQVHRTVTGFQDFSEETFLDRIKNVALAHGIEKGVIRRSEHWMCGKWHYAAAATIDAGRQSAADINENAAGLRSATNIFSENGEDFEEEVDELGYEERYRRDIAAKYDVPPESIRQPRPGSVPQAAAAAADDGPQTVDGNGPANNSPQDDGGPSADA